MKAEEINALAVLIAKCLNENFTREELSEISILLSQINSNLQTFIRLK